MDFKDENIETIKLPIPRGKLLASNVSLKEKIALPIY